MSLSKENQEKEPSKKIRKQLDESTLDIEKKKEPPNSQKLHEGLFKKNLHVRNSFQDIVRMVVPRGIGVRTYGYDTHKNRLAEGTLVTVYATNKNPDELCKREYDDLMNFVNNKLSVIRDNPYELKQVSSQSIVKIITEIDTEEKADRAFNMVKDGKKIYGQL
jgi:hypothetical protein